MAYPEDRAHAVGPFGSYRRDKTIAFTGGAGLGLAGSPIPLFTVTGSVWVHVVSFCTESLTESGATATLAVGISTDTGGLIAATNATTIDNGEIWWDASPVAMEVIASWGGAFIAGGNNIIGTVGGAQDIDDGTLTFVCFWAPLSSDGRVVAS